MLPHINHVYRFSFNSTFSSLDGVYKTLQLIPYDDFFGLGIDMVKYLYSKVNKGEEDWLADLSNYSGDVFIKLQNVTDETNIIYIPQSIMVKVPEGDIGRYQKLMVTVDLGVFDDEVFDDAIVTLKEVLEKRLGISVEPTVMKYDDVWLSKAEFATIAADREANKDIVENYYSSAKKAIDTEIELRTTIAALEAIIINSQ